LTTKRRTVNIAGHKTSASLEEGFWEALKEIASVKGIPVSKLVTIIDAERENPNLYQYFALLLLSSIKRNDEQ
jgi:predicted DNA-binding ribbon-helix-helix protein